MAPFSAIFMHSNGRGEAPAAPENNFWLWGTWGKRVIKAPFLTQKVPGKIRDIVIGQNFIIALKEEPLKIFEEISFMKEIAFFGHRFYTVSHRGYMFPRIYISNYVTRNTLNATV